MFFIEEMEDDEILFRTYKIKTSKIYHKFELVNDDGLCRKLTTNHQREDNKRFPEFFRLSLEQFDFVLGLIKDNTYKESYNRNL